MKTPILTAILSLMATWSAFAETSLDWKTNLVAALASARQNDQPVLLRFTASWCGPCKMMTQTTFKDARVLELLSRFAPVSIDIDEDRELAAQHQINAVPAFLLLTPNGTEVRRETGYQNPDQFLGWLTNGLVAYGAARESERQLLVRQQAIKTALQSQDAEARVRAVHELYALCALRDPVCQQFVDVHLKNVALNEPALLLDGLNHPQLATRIQIANVLREKLGKDFAFDPWEIALPRPDLVREWKKRLTSPRVPADSMLPEGP